MLKNLTQKTASHVAMWVFIALFDIALVTAAATCILRDRYVGLLFLIFIVTPSGDTDEG